MSSQLKTSFLTLSIFFFSNISYADDLDVIAPDFAAESNVLFVMDLSGSMNTAIPGAVPAQTRLDVLSDAFRGVIADEEFEDVNFGLALFSGDGQGADKASVGRGISYPVTPITGIPAQNILNNGAFTHPGNSYMPAAGATDSREYLNLLTNDPVVWNAGGYTPIVDALYEAALYFRGDGVNLGRFDASDLRSAHPSTYNGNITAGAAYRSPVEECSTDTVILLTDGQATINDTAAAVAGTIGNTYAQSIDTKFAGAACNTIQQNTAANPTATTDAEYFGRCGPELARFMSTEDQVNSIDDSVIKTYPVALALGGADQETIDYLNVLSNAGNGEEAIFVAGGPDASAKLAEAFKSIVADNAPKARSFSSPSYSVDTSTLLTNGPYVYIPVFDRKEKVWLGNLKKFKLVNGVLTDKDGQPALDANNGLKNTARDLWSSAAPATDSVTSGGAANRINPTARLTGKMFTANTVGTAKEPLTNLANDIFGAGTTDAEKAEFIEYISGTNPADGTTRNHMGDIIHSKPVQLNYANGSKLIFIGSNEGFLHAIKDNNNEGLASNGDEAFAFMPRESLKNIKDQYAGIPTPEHIYGVDGLITVWIDESNNPIKQEVDNGVVDANERAYIFFGLRRGGGTYTAIDVTNSETPILMWSKSFGTGNSWSQPTVANLTWKKGSDPVKTEEPVMIIGGGFNDDEFGIEQAGGNNIYVIDAMSGEEVWSSTNAFSDGNVSNFTGPALPNAVPAKIRAIDLDRNNSLDRLYFGDTGGNVWRVDLNAANFDTNPANDNNVSEITLHRIAELGGAGADNRQFFEEPDVAIFKRRGKLVASIAIGSGSRPNPLSTTVADKFYVLYDEAVSRLPDPTTDPLITSLQDLPVSQLASMDPNFKGWQKSLNSSTGEKVLSAALTFQGKVLFNSFATLSVSTDVCSPGNTNENKLYLLNIFDGAEELVYVPPGGNDGEILGPPSIVYPPNGPGETCDIGDCKRKAGISIGNAIIDVPPGIKRDLEKVYWIDSDN